MMFGKRRLSKSITAAAVVGISIAAVHCVNAVDVTFTTVAANGYATGDINSCAVGRNNLVTSGNYQFCAFYDTNRFLTIGRRTLGSSVWTSVPTTIQISASEITDDHNTIAIAIDGDGYLHTSWGMHNVQIRYAKTNNVVTTGTWNAARAAVTQINSITGANENSVTYPEFYNVPGSKDLLLVHRNGSSGNGNEYISRYNVGTTSGSGSWSRLQPTLMDGLTTSVNGYLNNLQYDSTGKLMMTWTWRGTPAFQSNHNIMYAESTDNGVTWKKQGGAAQTLPLNEGNAQVVKTIPTNSSLINQSTMNVDNNGRPMVATWYAPLAAQGDNSRQYMLEYYDGSAWQTSQITHRQENRVGVVADSEVRETGRPIVIVDQDNRVLVIMRQDEDANKIVAAYSTDRTNWDFVTLDTANMGTYEPTYDRILWERDHTLNLFYQQVGLGSASSSVKVLEWDVAAFFAPLPGVYWTQNGNGNWDTAGNWNGTVPNAVSAMARFGGGSTSISVSPTITIDGTKTVGTMSFNHPSSSFTLISGASGAIALNNGTLAAYVGVLDGNHTIGVPMTLTSAGAEFNVNGANDSLTLTSSLSGTGAITKSGAGVLAINRAGDTTLSNNFNMTGGLVRQDGAGVLTVTGTNTFAGGGFAAASGTLKRGNAQTFANGMSLTTSNTGRIDLNGFDLTLGNLSGTGGMITDDSGVAGSTRLTMNAASIVDYSGSISDGATRKLAITKNGNSTIKLRGNSNFSGGTNLDQGFVELYHNNALGTGSIVMNPGANNARLVLGDGVTVNNPVTMTTANAAVLTGSIMSVSDTATGTWSGAININALALNGGHFMGPRTSGVLNITGPVTATGTATFLIVREGFVRFSGGGSYTDMQIRASTVSIGADNGIATNAVLDIGGNGSTTVATNFDLNGFNQTLGGLKNALTNTNAAVATNTSVTRKTLSLNTGATTISFGGSIRGNLNLRMAGGRQILTKSGTTGLNGVYDYSGSTILDGGTLQLQSVAWNPVLNLGGAEINAGNLVFDYTGTTTPAPTVVSLLASSYNAGFTGAARFRSTLAPGQVGLTYTDNNTNQITVFAALFGDVNLDDKVNTLDFNVLANSWGTNGTWAQGNFNYDSTIDSVDFNLLVNNFGRSFPVASPSLGSLGSVVPEPAGASLLLFGTASLLRRTRR